MARDAKKRIEIIDMEEAESPVHIKQRTRLSSHDATQLDVKHAEREAD
jgi:hypothetical protein